MDCCVCWYITDHHLEGVKGQTLSHEIEQKGYCCCFLFYHSLRTHVFSTFIGIRDAAVAAPLPPLTNPPISPAWTIGTPLQFYPIKPFRLEDSRSSGKGIFRRGMQVI